MEEKVEKVYKSLDATELEQLIIYLNEKYRYGTEVVSDSLYDKVVDRLKSVKKDSKILTEIGAPVRDELVKVDLPFWMGSMDKVKPGSRELTLWLERYHGPYVVSGKLDGMACLYHKNCLYTRGNGRVGQDISYLLKHLQLPKIDPKFFVRGELIIKEKVFAEKYKNKFPKARSVVAGVINSKKPDLKTLLDIDMLAFEFGCLDKDFLPSVQFETLQKLGFDVPYNIIEENLTEENLPYIFSKVKSKSRYEVDGIILTQNKIHPRNTSGNPKYSVAYKMDAEGIETIVEDVLWAPSMYGALIPRIKIRPVIIDGDTITFATGYHAKNIIENNIGKKTVVEVIKAGDVIPKISKVVKSTKAEWPSRKIFKEYEWDETHVNLVLKDPLKNTEVLKERLLYFFKTFSVKFVSVGTISKFFKEGLDTPEKIYKAPVEDFEKLEGFQKKSAKKIYDSIHETFDRPHSLETVMSASLAFGQGFGEKKLYPLVSRINIYSKTEKGYTLVKPSMTQVLETEGFSELSAKKFLDHFEDFERFLKKNPFIKIADKKSKNKTGKLKNYYILFTGVRDKKLSEDLSSHGATIEGSFTKKVNLLVVKSADVKNNKTDRAKKENIEIIPIDLVRRKFL